MRSKPGRLAVALAAGILALGGCGPSTHVSPSARSSTSTTAATGQGATGQSAAAGQGAAGQGVAGGGVPDAAHIRALLVSAEDLPYGFTAAPDTEVGDDSVGLRPCGRLVLPVTGATAQARAAFDRNGNQEQVIEQVAAFDRGHAGALVAQLRQVADSCHQFDQTNAGRTVTLQITPIHPSAVGEEVAGVQLATSARFVDVVVVRSGQVDAILLLSEVGNTFPAAAMQAVVTAAGTKLASGRRG